jgi:hypothetical protein
MSYHGTGIMIVLLYVGSTAEGGGEFGGVHNIVI